MRAAMRNVAAFMRKFGAPVLKTPTIAPPERAALRVELLTEEFIETINAIEREDLVEIADGLADLVYVALGTAHEYGIPLDRVWTEVHRTNMAKAGGERREDGKILKPPGWTPPDIAGILAGRL